MTLESIKDSSVLESLKAIQKDLTSIQNNNSQILKALESSEGVNIVEYISFTKEIDHIKMNIESIKKSLNVEKKIPNNW